MNFLERFNRLFRVSHRRIEDSWRTPERSSAPISDGAETTHLDGQETSLNEPLTAEMEMPDLSSEVDRETKSIAAVELNEDERREAYWRQLKIAFTAKEARCFEKIIKEEHNLDVSFLFDPSLTFHPTCFVLTIENRKLTFRFCMAQTPDAYTVLIVERWWAMLPLIIRLLHACGDRSVRTIVNLNDEGVEQGLTFCDRRSTFSLIPDPVFIGMKGYAKIRDQFAAQQIGWHDKADVVFWRGTSTGCPTGPRHELPRVTLCRLCRSDTSGLFDVGFTALVDHLANETEQSELKSFVSDYIEPYHFDKYKYHIDIDGHTNSWPGLMFKLHSGGLVFKVESPENYSQWYYERLRPWENYVPVKSDLSDLLDLVAYFRHNDVRAQAIAEEGRRLAQSMTFSNELDVGVRTILGRCEREAYLSSTNKAKI